MDLSSNIVMGGKTDADDIMTTSPNNLGAILVKVSSTG
jgi:hypothetical protein